ncbi:glycerol-3-phosphate dehydrogenase/oxidase [Parasalinivibrio latis]|uniref:glycerol-3-phosphate dehydrogenase/oxidase n=1 Tax=Parasalinivibrio latis TaxID=2952610 RepID=UPI0030E3879A
MQKGTGNHTLEGAGFHRALDGIEDGEVFDAVVIGGGINGIATYRELSLQGLNVLLVERDDFCSKASAAPSRMIHGGLRYLENAEFDLVKESLFERNRLLENAPHYVRPLETHIPLYSWSAGLLSAGLRFFGLNQKTSDRGALVVKTGLAIYDFFTRRDQIMPKHSLYTLRETRRRWPGYAEAVKCSASYYDAWISAPERLAIELIQDGEQNQNKPHALNYTEARIGHDGSVILTDKITGNEKSVVSHHIVNATGAWIDLTNEGVNLASRYIGGTKGSHIIVDNPAMVRALDGAMVYYENAENRVCIMFPYLGKVLIGSTDIPVSDPDSVICTQEEVDYILTSVKHIFPDVEIREEDICYRFSGVRPLGTANTASTGQIPRSHALKCDVLETGEQNSSEPLRVYSMVGGKWTTFRGFAEQACDTVLAELSKPRKVSTRDRRIGGGKAYPMGKTALDIYLKNLRDEYQISAERASILLSRYGTACEAVLSFIQAGEDTSLSSLPEYSVRELTYLVKTEYVVKPLDLIQRRSTIAIEGKVNPAVLAETTLLLAQLHGWDDTRTAEEYKEAAESLNYHNGYDIDPAGMFGRESIDNSGKVLCM